MTVSYRIVAGTGAVVAALVLLTGCDPAHPQASGGLAQTGPSPSASTATTPATTTPTPTGDSSATSATSAPVSSTPASTTAPTRSTSSSAPRPTTTTTAPATTSSTPPAGSVGVPPGTALRPSGSFTADTPGQVVDGLDVSGSIVVTAPNVVIRNSRFTGTGGTPWAIQTQGSGSVLIQDVTIRGDYTDAGIAYANWTAQRVEIVGMTNDGAKMGNNVSISDSWIHDFTPTSGAHADGLQLIEDVGNIVIQNNRIDPGGGVGANSAIFLSPDIGPQVNGAGPITVSGNQLGGGGYTLYVVGGSNGAVLTDVRVTGNRWLRDEQYGPIRAETTPTSASDNAYTDGQPIPWPV